MRHTFALLASLFLIASCSLFTPHAPSPGQATCADACAHARDVCGPSALAPERGGTCEDVCDNATANAIDFHTGCVFAAGTCDAVHACGRTAAAPASSQ